MVFSIFDHSQFIIKTVGVAIKLSDECDTWSILG